MKKVKPGTLPRLPKNAPAPALPVPVKKPKQDGKIRSIDDLKAAGQALADKDAMKARYPKREK